MNVKNLLKHVSLEPAVFLVQFGRFMLEGAQIQADLLLWKICHLELNYSESVCGNLTSVENEDINNQVQSKANSFLMVNEWLMSGPALIFSFFVGSLADNYGCKPFILLPLIGWLISDIGILINYIFIESLPLEFFYVEPLWSFFGGKAVYYLGVYGYRALISRPDKRATLLARYDGCELIAKIIATLASPYVRDSTNRYGNFIAKCSCTFASIIYITFVVGKNAPNTAKEVEKKDKKSFMAIIRQLVFSPLIEMAKAIFKRRPKKLHILIAIQFFMFGTYWFVLEERALLYFYMLKTFEGFDSKAYSWFFAYILVVNAIGLLIVLPFFSNYFKAHDSLLLTITLTSETAGLLFSAFCNELWQFYIAYGIQFMGFCKYGLVRSMLSKCVSKNETGKMFSALAILAALAPILGNPAFRGLYNQTIETFPAAEILLATSVLLLSSFLNFVVYTQRWRMVQETKEGIENSTFENTAL